ncbi:MAG: hypothetical protein OXH00_17935 [Candidatus Poribacteria bacterium]|nr:hypothetical protein [Candidatus Poribacteria bacterium]
MTKQESHDFRRGSVNRIHHRTSRKNRNGRRNEEGTGIEKCGNLPRDVDLRRL